MYSWFLVFLLSINYGKMNICNSKITVKKQVDCIAFHWIYVVSANLHIDMHIMYVCV